MITSKQNSLIKEIRSLSDKKFRDRLNLFVIEGVKPVKEALSLNIPLYAVIGTGEVLSQLCLNGYVLIFGNHLIASFLINEQ